MKPHKEPSFYTSESWCILFVRDVALKVKAMMRKAKVQILTENVAETLVKFAMPPPTIRILPERE